jgi:hypothetical protein
MHYRLYDGIATSGQVCETDEQEDTFTVSIRVSMTQNIYNLAHPSPLIICATLTHSDSYLNAFQFLPPLNSIVMFSAQVVNMQHGVAIVIDDNHSYFISKRDTVDGHKKTVATQT